MVSKTSFRALPVSFLVVASSVVAACGADPSAGLLNETEAAAGQPTGEVNATAMKYLASVWGSIVASEPVLSGLATVNPLDTKCKSGGAVDLACATQGSATGSLVFTSEAPSGANGTSSVGIYELKNVCSSGICVEGSMATGAFGAGTSKDVVAGYSTSITRPGETTFVRFGEQTRRDGSPSFKLVIFDSNGASYVIEMGVTPQDGEFSVTGANGTFQCPISTQGGQCSGASTFNY